MSTDVTPPAPRGAAAAAAAALLEPDAVADAVAGDDGPGTQVATAAPAAAPRRAARRGPLQPVPAPGARRDPTRPAVVGTALVLFALFAVAIAHAFLITGQVRLDRLHRDVAAESERIRQLRLSVAELESPERVLRVARDRLGMVEPGEVGYLLPSGVAAPEDAEPVKVEPAEAAPAPTPAAGTDPPTTEPAGDAGAGPPAAEHDGDIVGPPDPGRHDAPADDGSTPTTTSRPAGATAPDGAGEDG